MSLWRQPSCQVSVGREDAACEAGGVYAFQEGDRDGVIVWYVELEDADGPFVVMRQAFHLDGQW